MKEKTQMANNLSKGFVLFREIQHKQWKTTSYPWKFWKIKHCDKGQMLWRYGETGVLTHYWGEYEVTPLLGTQWWHYTI